MGESGTPFRSLQQVDPSEAARLFPAAVGLSQLRLWRPGDPIEMTRRLLVGIDLSWLQDLSLLDVLNEGVERRGTSYWPKRRRVLHVDVFNFADARHIDEYIPGMGRAAELGTTIRTPVVGRWVRGELYDKAWGERTLELLADALDMRLRWMSGPRRWDAEWHVIIE